MYYYIIDIKLKIELSIFIDKYIHDFHNKLLGLLKMSKYTCLYLYPKHSKKMVVFF